MLTVAPSGRTKRLIRLSTWLYCSKHFMVVGKVAALNNDSNHKTFVIGLIINAALYQSSQLPMHLRRKSLVFSRCSDGSACNGVLNWKAGATTKRDSTAYRLTPVSKTSGFKLLLLQAQMMRPQQAALNSQLLARNSTHSKQVLYKQT